MPALLARLGRPRSRGLPLLKKRRRRSGVAPETSMFGTRRIPVSGATSSRTRESAGRPRARGAYLAFAWKRIPR
eukprot:3774007-Alexandrium_andersonii.AAC.1